MVQPRKEQLKNVLTRHSRFDYSAVPGDVETLVLEATLDAAVISDTPGGSQEDLPAFVAGGVEPFAILPSDSVAIQRQSDPFVTVVFATGDTTASKIAAAINAAVGTDIAFNSEGRLLIRNDVIGDDSVLVLNDAVSGTWLKLGITPATYAGSFAPVRGVLTNSLAGLAFGGHVLLRTVDGKNVVTDCPSVSHVGIPSAPRLRADVPGGVPVHGRIQYDVLASPPYSIRYFAKMPLEPRVVTSLGDLALLDGTDFLTLTFTPGVPFPSVGPVFAFPTGPGLTRDQVIDVINEEFGKVATGSLTPNGNAEVLGLVGQPYSFVTGDIVEIAMDGGSFVPVTMTTGSIPASDVVTLVNTALGGSVASVVDDGLGNVTVKLRSLTTDGRTSSVELRNGTPGFPTLEKLGMSAGLYRGYFVAEPYGTAEIRIRGLARGPASSVTVSASATTEARLGLASATYVGTAEGEQPVAFPLLNPSSPTAPQVVTALIPEVLEFGEVDPGVESTVEQFNAKSAGSNLDPDRASSGSLTGPGAADLVGRSRGVADAGKPVVTNALGLVDTSFLRAVQDDSYRFFKKLVRGDFTSGVNSVDAVVTDVLETPGAEGHGGTNVGLFTVDVDRPDLLSSRQFRLRFGKLAGGGPKLPFSVTEVGIAGAEWLVNGQDTNGDGTAFGNATGPMKVLDANTDAAGLAHSGTRFIPVSGSQAPEGDRTLRIMEREEAVLETVSLFRQVNGRWTATCGDGVNSFGDFNGVDAIQNAISFYTLHHPTFEGFVLQLKAGQFEVDSSSGEIRTATVEVTLEGMGPSITSIANTDASADTIIVDSALKLTLKNLRVRDLGTLGANGITVEDGATLVLEDVEIEDCKLTMNDSKSVRMVRGSIDVIGAGVPCMEFVMSDGAPGGEFHGRFLFQDVTFRSDEDNPVTRVSALSSAIPVTRIREVAFESCRMYLRSTTDDGGGNMVGNCGVLDLSPNGSDVRTGTDTGVIVDRISYRDCTVRANTQNSVVSCLMHLIPQGNGVVFGLGTSFMGVTRLEIDGGSWLAPSVNTAFNPFTALEAGTVIGTASQADEDGGLFIRNALMGFAGSDADSGITHGSPTADVDGTLWMGTGNAAPATGVWGSWALGGKNIEVLDTVFTGFSQFGGTPALGVRWDRFRMQGCTFNRFKLLGPSTAEELVTLRPRIYAGSSVPRGVLIKDIVVEGRELTGGGSIGNIFNVEPNALGSSLPLPSVGRLPDSPVVLDNVQVRGFVSFGGVLPVLAHLVFADGFVTAGSLYVGSYDSFQNITVKNCKIDKISAIFWFGGAGGSMVYMKGLRLLGNEALNGAQVGVNLTSGHAATVAPSIDYAEIVDNHIEFYEDEAVVVAQDRWDIVSGTRNEKSSVQMTGNRLIWNDGAGFGDQVLLSTSVIGVGATFADMRVHGVFRDNNLGSDGNLGLGSLRVNGRDAGGAIVHLSDGVNPATIFSFGAPLRGVSTGWPYANTSAGNDVYERFLSNFGEFIYNIGILRSP